MACAWSEWVKQENDYFSEISKQIQSLSTAPFYETVQKNYMQPKLKKENPLADQLTKI